MHWLQIAILLFVLITLYRRMSLHGVGRSVGRTKAKMTGTSARPRPNVPPLRDTSDLARDYQALDLKPGASFDEVKNAYRELAKVWHPDRFGNDAKLKERANIKLGEINAAYERLKNHLSR